MTNVEPIRGAIASATPVRPKRGAGGGNGGPAIWDGPGLPPGCRVRPVGVKGVQCIFLDALDQLTFAGPRELGEAYLTHYFAGDTQFLQEFWPRIDKRGGINGFSPEDARRSIQQACAECGIWDDADSVRGRGAWRTKDGELLLHCGDVLVTRARIEDPGVFDGAVYPARGKIRRPLDFSARIPRAEDPKAAAQEVYTRLLTWNWSRGALDARFYLGLIVCGFLGGALRWRPSGWVTAEAGVGKSYLMDLRRDLMGGWSINASDATAAGIFQRLEFDSIAVSLDEQESGSDNRKLDSMVELAREAASGDLRLRGSAGHAGVSFAIRSSFVFSSINMAPLKDQDMSRQVRLHLSRRGSKAQDARWTPVEAERWGREILRVMMERWHRWDATLEAHKEALARLGHDKRGQDTFGTLLAAADLVLAERGYLNRDQPDDDPHTEEIWMHLEPKAMPEYADRTPNWLSCIQHLVSARPRDWKTGGEVKASLGAQIDAFLDEYGDKPHQKTELEKLNGVLALGGVTVRFKDTATRWQLCVPNSHPQLTKIFEGTDWPGKPNAPGGWAGAMKAGDAGIVEPAAKFYLDGRQQRGVAIRLDRVLGIRAGVLNDQAEET